MAKEVTNKKKGKKTLWIIIGSVLGLLLLLLILAVAFGTPSAETVFKNMNEEMLKTKSVTLNLEYKGTGTATESVNLTSKTYLNLESTKNLVAKGDFTLNLVTEGIPIKAKANFIKLNDNSFIKFTELSSTNSEISASFAQTEAKLKNNWVKVKDGDNFSSFVSIPLDSATSILPTPFANLNESQRKTILGIIGENELYTTEETSKVKIGDQTAYKYQITYDKDKYSKMAKAISGYNEYFKYTGEEDSDIKSLTIWVDTDTYRIIKLEFTGTSKQGNVEGKILFSGYNEKLNVTNPTDYSLESELLK